MNHETHEKGSKSTGSDVISALKIAQMNVDSICVEFDAVARHEG